MRPRRGRTAALLAAVIVMAGLPLLVAGPAGAATARSVARACPSAVVPEGGFTDTDGLDANIALAIDCIVAWELARGTSVETFAPGNPVVRGQMATFLVNTLRATTGYQAPAEPEDAFKDDDGTTHEQNINVLAAEAIAKGTGAESFSPSAPVTRGQMATFVAATLRNLLGSLPAPTKNHFGDDNGSTHEVSINTLADLGIVTGTASGGYEPSVPVLRRQMALFLARSLDLLVERGKATIPFPEVAVKGEPETLQFGESRDCVVGSASGAKIQLAVLPAANVTEAEDGTLTFADLNQDGIADAGGVVAEIAAVDGAGKPADTKKVDDVTSDGSVAVTLSASDEGDVVLVAFVDKGATAHALDLTLSGAPGEPADTGCPTSWIPPEATIGTHTGVVVNAVNTEAEVAYFTGKTSAGSPGTFFYETENDTFEGKATDVGAFEALISKGDVVTVSYATDPADVSNFNVTKDTVQAPGEPLVTAKNLDEGTTRNDLEVVFPEPAYNGAGTEYRVERLKTFKAVDGTCTEDAASGFLSIGTTPHSPFVDSDVADGCYQYRAWGVSPTGVTFPGPLSAPVESGLPDEDEAIRPLSQFASVTKDDSPAQQVSQGDIIRIRFNEKMAEPNAGDSITVTSAGVSATLTHLQNAFFALNVADEPFGGSTAPRGTVLTIRVDATPASTVSWPADVTNHTGVTDIAGNSWDVAGSSDKTLGIA